MWLENIKANKRNAAAGLFIIVLAVGFFALNWLTHLWYFDDYDYRFMVIEGVRDMSRPIRNVGDIIVSQVNHYIGMNGRSIVHFFVQLFAGLLGKGVFNYCNTLVFTAFVLFVSIYCGARKKSWIFLFTLTAACILLLITGFNQTMLWQTGAINYLWSATAITFYLLLLRRDKGKAVRPFTFLLAICGLMAGWSHEGLSFPLALSLVLYSVFKRKTISKSQAIAIVAFFMGMLICMFAPSTMGKVHETGVSIVALISRAVGSLLFLLKFPIVYVLVFFLLIERHFNRETTALQWLNDNLLLVSCIVLAMGINLATGITYKRAAFGFNFYCLLLLVKTVANLPMSKRVQQVFTACAMVVSMVTLCFVLHFAAKYHNEYKDIIAQMEADGNHCIIKTNIEEMPDFALDYVLKPVETNKEIDHYFPDFKRESSEYMAYCYHKDSLVFLPQYLLEKMRTSATAYKTFENDAQLPYYVIQTNRPDFKKVTYMLREATSNDIPFFLRPFANRMARYTQQSIEASPSCYKPVHVFGRYYLLVAHNHVIDNRIVDIKVE